MTKNFQENWPKCEKENTDYFLRFFQTQRVESHGFSVDYITITREIVLPLLSRALLEYHLKSSIDILHTHSLGEYLVHSKIFFKNGRRFRNGAIFRRKNANI